MPIRLTPAVKWLLIACGAMFVIQQTADQFLGQNFQGIFGLVPSRFVLGFQFWQIITYAFLHGDVLHLFLNLMMLVFIGGELESLWGTKRFLQYYFTCTTVAGLLYLLIQLVIWKGDQPMVGASGGIYGLLVAYGILFGERVLLFMLLFPMKAKHFIWILAAVEFMTSVFSHSRGGALSSIAHLGGMGAGFVFLIVRARLSLARKGGGGAKVRKKSSHLKLVIDNDEEKPKRTPPRDPKTWH